MSATAVEEPFVSGRLESMVTATVVLALVADYLFEAEDESAWGMGAEAMVQCWRAVQVEPVAGKALPQVSQDLLTNRGLLSDLRCLFESLP